MNQAELLDALLHEALDAASSAEPDADGQLPAEVQDYLDALAELAGEWGDEP